MKKSLRVIAGLCSTLLWSSSAFSMTTQGNQILNSDGKPVQLKGVNWFGFNNSSTMVDGLWNSDKLSGDFSTVVYRMQLLGFNAVRLPFSFKDLNSLSPRSFTRVCPAISQSEIQANVTNPGVPVPSGKTIPPMVSPAPSSNNCNDYLPNDTTFNRFVWVVNFFAKNGFYVLIDNHLREDQSALENQQQWVQSWVNLVSAIVKDPVSKRMLMIDILNEPDNYGIRWEASGGKPGLKDLYISMMDAVYPVAPDALYFVEGTGQSGINANWGDGFATDPSVISSKGLSDPNPFFTTLLSKPYLNQVVVSPHVYPPSVTGGTGTSSGAALWDRLSTSFGYLNKKGYCPTSGSGSCHVFPVAIGEFGSKFDSSADIQSMKDIANYLVNADGGNDGRHNTIDNWFYWSWNANSGDTGGLVTDNWRDIQWTKIDYLSRSTTYGPGLGLTPWYAASVVPPTNGTLCLQLASTDGLAVSNLKPITVGSYTYTITSFDQPVCQTVATGNYTISLPVLTVGSTQYTGESKTATVTEGQTTTVSLNYTGNPIVSQGIAHVSVTGLTGSMQSTVTIGNQKVTLSASQPTGDIQLAPGTYTVSASAISDYTVTVNPTSITVPNQNGTFEYNVAVNYQKVAQTGACEVQVMANSPWEDPWGSGKYSNVVNLFVKNLGSTTVNTPWTLSITGASFLGASQSWNCDLTTRSGQTIQCTANQSWESLQPNGGNSINVGMILSASSQSFQPTSIQLNGTACTIK